MSDSMNGKVDKTTILDTVKKNSRKNTALRLKGECWLVVHECGVEEVFDNKRDAIARAVDFFYVAIIHVSYDAGQDEGLGDDETPLLDKST